MTRFFAFALLLAAASAFQATMPRLIRPQIAPSSTVRFIMSESEAAALLDAAEDCAAGECSLDDVSDLIEQLQEQEQILQARIDKVMNMVSHLQHANEKEDRSTDELKQLIQDTLRVFSQTKARFNPTGYAGEVGKGSQTAWDVLAPKKWSP